MRFNQNKQQIIPFSLKCAGMQKLHIIFSETAQRPNTPSFKHKASIFKLKKGNKWHSVGQNKPLSADFSFQVTYFPHQGVHFMSQSQPINTQ